MREIFLIALTGVNPKTGDTTGVIRVALNAIICIYKEEKATKICVNGSNLFVKEGIDEIIKRTSSYGLIRAV